MIIHEESDDDASYSDEKLVDEDKDDEENNCSTGDDNDMVPHDSSDNDNIADRLRLAQQSAGDPPHDTSLKANKLSLTVLRGMSNAVSIVKHEKHEKHVATQIIQFFKSEVFHLIKFVNSAEMFQKAIVKVIELEKVPPHNRLLFQLTYDSCFNQALNTKRSLYEQALLLS